MVSLVMVQLHHGQAPIATPAAKCSANEDHQADQDGQEYLSGTLCCNWAPPHLGHILLSLHHPINHIGNNNDIDDDDNDCNNYNDSNADSIHAFKLTMS